MGCTVFTAFCSLQATALLVPLDRLLWRSGAFNSRAEARGALDDGRVHVNGEIQVCNAIVDPEETTVSLDNKLLPPPPPTVLVAMHKPRGVVTTCGDAASPTVMQVMPPALRQPCLAPVGRLDQDTEGLLLFTNCGTLSKLLLERGACEKTYIAQVEPRGPLARHAGELASTASDVESRRTLDAALARMAAGIRLSNGYLAQAARCRALDEADAHAAGCASFENLLSETFGVEAAPCRPPRMLVEVTMRQGAKREVRRLLKAAGYRTRRLCRVAVGGVRLGELASGATAQLCREEMLALFASACDGAVQSASGVADLPAYDDARGRWLPARELAQQSTAGLSRLRAGGQRARGK